MKKDVITEAFSSMKGKQTYLWIYA